MNFKCTFNSIKLLSLFALISFSADASPLSQEDKIVKRVRDHLIINDPSSAVEEAYLALHTYSSNKQLWEAYISALAKSGDEVNMMKVWDQYAAAFPTAYQNNALIEDIAWGTLSKAATSPTPQMRAMAMLGAFFSQDAKGINVLHKGLSDSNSLVRGISVKLASHLHDAKLCDAVLVLFRNEKVWEVRLETVKAVGMMKIHSAKPDLIALIANDSIMAEEKAAAIQALVNMMETAERPEIHKLTQSDRAGLRILACNAVALLGLKDDVDLISPLLQDHCSEVRSAALQTIGMLRTTQLNGQPIVNVIEAFSNDPDPAVAINAAWVITLNDTVKGQKAFERWLAHDRRDLRIHAAAALGACGKYGMPLIVETFNKHEDPFVRLNLGISLIGQRVEVDKACQELHQALTDKQEKWTREDYGAYQAIIPGTLSKAKSLKSNRDEINDLARLEVMNIIAVMRYPKAQEAITSLLQQKSWGITGVASALLLTEGDDAALELVKNLLDHPTYQVRVQAALILSLWGRDAQSIAFLQQAYASADREMKERILEGIGRVGDRSSIPFLMEHMHESSQSLRVIAAACLLECLYN